MGGPRLNKEWRVDKGKPDLLRRKLMCGMRENGMGIEM
jgi:hypothetical protein